MTASAADLELDLRGLLCPLPVIRASAASTRLDAGARLVLLCTDPGVEQDFPIWCRMHGHHLDEVLVAGHEYRLTIVLGPDHQPG